MDTIPIDDELANLELIPPWEDVEEYGAAGSNTHLALHQQTQIGEKEPNTARFWIDRFADQLFEIAISDLSPSELQEIYDFLRGEIETIPHTDW
jgi:hypothetical protein